MFETLDYTIRIGSTPTFLYFDLYLNKYSLSYEQKSCKCSVKIRQRCLRITLSNLNNFIPMQIKYGSSFRTFKLLAV